MNLIANARQWWRLNSIQIAAFWSVVGGAIIAAWPVAKWYLDEMLPEGPWRVAVGGAVSAVTLGSFLYARLRPQPKLEKTDGQ